MKLNSPDSDEEKISIIEENISKRHRKGNKIKKYKKNKILKKNHKNADSNSNSKEIKKLNMILFCLIIIIVISLIIIIHQSYKLYNNITNQKNEEDSNPRKISDNVEIKTNLMIDIKENKSNNIKEHFYLYQNISNIDLNSFSSPQFKNPRNIKLIPKLEISLSIEYKKFFHMKIKDAEKERWEIPKNDILNKDYLDSIGENIIYLSEKSKQIEADKFNINFSDNKFSFKLTTKEGNQFYLFNTSKNFIFSDTFINFQSELTSDDIYGFGERSHDFKLGQGLYTMWTQDTSGTSYDIGTGGRNQYGHQPIALHKTKYNNLWLGFVFMNTNDQDVKISKNLMHNSFNLEHKTIGGIIDYYIIVDNSPEEVIKNIHFLLGIPALPPFWSLGNHQSRYGYRDFNEFKNVYEQFKKYEIPIDVMWIDIDAMKDYEIFTVNEKFEQIGEYIKDEIHKDEGKFVPIVDLGVSYENQNSNLIKLGNELDIFIKSNYTKKSLIGQVWPGKTVFPDFMNSNISKFWNKGLSDYRTLVNFDGIWLDMNEPSNLVLDSKCTYEIANEEECTADKNIYNYDDLVYIPGFNQQSKKMLAKRTISDNALLKEGNWTSYNAKPLIAFYEGKVTYDYLYNDLNTRPFILSRCTTLGSGKYMFHWLGDNHSVESDLKNSISGIFNFNIFGIPFTGDDICGFLENCNKNLCLRWYNLGAFYPFMRNHNKKLARDQFPWSFNYGDGRYKAIELIKKVINLRYSLLRYMYSQLFLISINQKGSFFKPIMFEFPEDANSYKDIESKIMFGEAFLLCAFYRVNEMDKEFVLPNLDFNSYPSGKSIKKEDENNKIILSGKLDEIHLFLREGFIISKQNTFDKYILNTMKLRKEKMDLIINIDKNKQGKGVLFFDNDDKDTIKDKTYIRVDLNFSNDKLEIITNKNNLAKYNFDDHKLGYIELWNANRIYKENKGKYNLELKFKNEFNKDKLIMEGNYFEENNKIIYEISKNSNDISLFDVENINFNF